MEEAALILFLVPWGLQGIPVLSNIACVSTATCSALTVHACSECSEERDAHQLEPGPFRESRGIWYFFFRVLSLLLDLISTTVPSIISRPPHMVSPALGVDYELGHLRTAKGVGSGAAKFMHLYSSYSFCKTCTSCNQSNFPFIMSAHAVKSSSRTSVERLSAQEHSHQSKQQSHAPLPMTCHYWNSKHFWSSLSSNRDQMSKKLP